MLYLAENKDPWTTPSTSRNWARPNGFASSRHERAMWSPPGSLLFVREGTLFAQPMDPRTFQVQGEPQAIAQDVAANDTGGRSTFAVSSNGVLAYRSGAPVETRQLTWRDRDGQVLGTVGLPEDPQPLHLSGWEKRCGDDGGHGNECLGHESGERSPGPS